ncbi:MFS transporter [Runella aurantiaca]|uniref:ATP/ADP translocase n=1 Tax=Runella aurantiaca TaxID=2282308 RepID=A0A369HYX8_9BACT|nr:MFS transporter [Runella aurantiaca]RDB02741.1 hypothetical protein DVG78_27435 [Runella aurantiaca]
MLKKERLYHLMNLKEGDLKVVNPFMRYSFFMGVSVAIFYTATMSLFLNSFDRTMLPKAYIASGIIVYALGYIVSKIQERVYFSKIALFLIIFLIISVTGLLIGHFITGNKWIYFFLFIWNRVFVFVNGISFWAIVSRIFNLQQAKRLVSFITTGDVISSIVSYLSVPLLLQLTDTNGLLYLSIGTLVFCLVLMVTISKRYESELSIFSREKEKPKQKTFNYFFKTPYYTAVFMLALFPVMGLFYVEFIFAVESKKVFPDKELLTGFLGLFFGLCAIIELLIKTLLYGRFIEKYGLKLGLVVLPLVLTIFYAFAAVYGTFYGTTYVFFAFIVMSRFAMSTVRKSISDPSYQLLFQPIHPEERLELQSRIEGGPKAGGNIVAGVLLLVLTYFTFIDTIYLSYIFVGILLVWLWVAVSTQTLYRNVLKNLLKESAERKNTSDKKTTETFMPVEYTGKKTDFDVVTKMANSPLPEERLESVSLLENSGRYYAFKYIDTLMQDPNPRVKRAALLAAGNIRKMELWPHLLSNITSNYFKLPTKIALASIGDPVMGELERFFNRSENDRATQKEIISIVEKIDSLSSTRFLRAKMNHPDPHIRDRVFEALNQNRYTATVLERTHINAEIDEKAAFVVWLIAAQSDIARMPDLAPLLRSLEEETKQTAPKLFNLLNILIIDQDFDLIKDLHENKNETTQGFVQEVFSMALSEELRVKLTPIFEDDTIEDKVQKCRENYPQQHLSPEERVLDIINRDFAQLSSELKASAIQSLLHFPNSQNQYVLISSAHSNSEVIVETALYVLHKLYPTAFEEFKETAAFLPNCHRTDLCKKIEHGFKQEDLLINKLNAIRSIDLLKKLPADSLLPMTISLQKLQLTSYETLLIDRYCTAGPPLLFVYDGEIELLETDGNKQCISEGGYWFREPEPPPKVYLHSVNALKDSTIFLLDPYLVYNLIAENTAYKEDVALETA